MTDLFVPGDAEFYSLLLNAWCPQVGQVKVYLTDTGEEAILLEEWLRLRMIRSDVPQVVQAGKGGTMRCIILSCRPGSKVGIMRYFILSDTPQVDQKGKGDISILSDAPQVDQKGKGGIISILSDAPQVDQLSKPSEGKYQEWIFF